jgi:hypothetical protein
MNHHGLEVGIDHPDQLNPGDEVFWLSANLVENYWTGV